MKLGLLGPAAGNLAALARAARFILHDANVTRGIYLGADDALEETVATWAESLVGPNPSSDRTWDRALPVAMNGTTNQIDDFVRAERARLRLKALERLPPDELRSVEILGDRVAVMAYDKALLDEEDIFSASYLLYGKSDGPLVKCIGPRWFLTPGPVGCAGGGALVLEDTGGQVLATLCDADGRPSRQDVLVVAREAKLSVKG